MVYHLELCFELFSFQLVSVLEFAIDKKFFSHAILHSLFPRNEILLGVREDLENPHNVEDGN